MKNLKGLNLVIFWIISGSFSVISESGTKVLEMPLQLKRFIQKTRNPRVFSHPKVYRCDDQGRDLVVNFVNLNYPDDDTKGYDCKFRLIITSPQICQIRVDFVDTEMLRPTRGDCLSQSFEVEGAIWPTGLSPLCGKQNDQHFYLHLEPWASNSTFIDFKLNRIGLGGSGGEAYRFGVWLTQIDCSSFNVLKAPDGCTQYFMGESGTLKSFNYEGSSYLNGQNYVVCIRSGKGMCGIRYEAKSGEFGIRKSIPPGNTVAALDAHLRSGTGPSLCGMDYLMIPDGKPLNAEKNTRNEKLFFKRRQSAPAPAPARIVVKNPELTISADRYCGGKFSPNNLDNTNHPVYAKLTSNLFTLQVKFSSSPGATFLRQNALNSTLLGFRLSYQQIRSCERMYDEKDMITRPKLGQFFQSLNGINRPLSTTIYRDDLDLLDTGTDQIVSTIMTSHSSPSFNRKNMSSVLLHRFGTNSSSSSGGTTGSTVGSGGSVDNDEDAIWDYLDENWETNPDETYDDI